MSFITRRREPAETSASSLPTPSGTSGRPAASLLATLPLPHRGVAINLNFFSSYSNTGVCPRPQLARAID